MPILSPTPTLDAIIEDFRGPWLRPQTTDVPASEALLSLNASYNPHSVETRFGFGPFWAAGKAITTLFNWVKVPDFVSAAGNYLIFYSATDGAAMWAPNLLSPAAANLFSVTAEGLSIASAGNQVAIASFSASAGIPTPVGAAQCHIVGVPPLGTTYVDKAFLGPLTTKPTLSNSGSGTVTAGLHSIGYIITTRNGFTGALSPALAGGTFDTSSNITAPGGEQIGFSLTATWPVEAEGIQIIMSTTTNPYQYFIVPGLNFAVPGGSPFTVNAVIDISDALLAATGTDVTSNQFFLTQSTGGTGPFNPFATLVYGSRMVYLTYDSTGIPAAYVSEPNNYQQLTEAFNKLKLPGFRQITSAFVLRGILYLLGPNWTFAFEDNEGLPSTWPSPTLIDGNIGTLCCLGTTVSEGGDWAAVVHQTGLYIFNGQYSELPLTYMVDFDWKRINWNASQTIRITNHTDQNQLIVAVPLDGATAPSHLMVFDYTNGLDEESVKYSLWDIAGYTPRGLCVFQNPSTARMEILISPGSASGKILRQMNAADDASPYEDDGGAIPFTWECAPQPDGSIGQVFAHVGGYVRASGKGTLTPTSYSLDRQIARPWPRPIKLSESPGVEYFRQFYLTSERCSVRFTCGTNPGDHVTLSGYRHRYYPWATRR